MQFHEYGDQGKKTLLVMHGEAFQYHNAPLAILKTLRGDCQKREERKRKGYTNKFGDE